MKKQNMIKSFLIIFVLLGLGIPRVAKGSGNDVNGAAGSDATALVASMGGNGAAAAVMFKMAKTAKGPEKALYYGLALSAVAQAASQAGNFKGAKAAQRDSNCTSMECSQFGWPPNTNNNGGQLPPPDWEKPDGFEQQDPTKQAKNNRPGSQQPNGTPPPFGGGAGGVGGGGSNGLDRIAEEEARKLRNLENEIKREGYSLTKDGEAIQTPKGKLNPDSLNNSAGMAAAGFTPAQIRAAEDAKSKAGDAAEKRYNEIVAQAGTGLGEDGGGGRSPSSVGAAGLPAEDFDANKFLKQFAGSNTVGKPTVAGLQKKLDGEPIGVAGDNIFQMVSRRYQQFHREGKFLNSDGR